MTEPDDRHRRFLNELIQAYDLLQEVLRFPAKHGKIPTIPKGGKPASKSPIDLRLLDKKNYIDSRIEIITEEILEIIRFK